MARKHKHPEHVNHERWLVSYADFITLLFAFFVVMFAVSQVDTHKVGRFTQSFQQAVNAPLIANAGLGVLPGSPTPGDEGEGAWENKKSKLAAELESLKRAIEQSEEKEIQQGVKIFRRKNELVLRLPDDIVFASGDDRIKEKAARLFRAIGSFLKTRRVEVRVEGHTDTVPIHTARFRSNWDLSAARATAVIEELADAGMAPERLGTAGYGEFRPIASNDSASGRAQNRRVDLVVSELQKDPESSEEKPAKGEKGDRP